jgi:hypothetical protein
MREDLDFSLWEEFDEVQRVKQLDNLRRNGIYETEKSRLRNRGIVDVEIDYLEHDRALKTVPIYDLVPDSPAETILVQIFPSADDVAFALAKRRVFKDAANTRKEEDFQASYPQVMVAQVADVDLDSHSPDTLDLTLWKDFDPLYFAAQQRNRERAGLTSEIIARLLSRGISVNFVDYFDNEPLQDKDTRSVTLKYEWRTLPDTPARREKQYIESDPELDEDGMKNELQRFFIRSAYETDDDNYRKHYPEAFIDQQ